MHKFSYKTLFIILFFLLIGIVILVRFVFPNQKVSAAWWNDSWMYRQKITTTNGSGSNQTNTKVRVLFNYDLSSLVTAGKLQSSLNDIRFTDINGKLLTYWIEDSTNNSTDIWVLMPSIPSSGATIYMYYGNSSAATMSNSDATPSSCLEIVNVGITASGNYWIDPDGGSGTSPFTTYCDLSTDSGGWTMLFNLDTSDGNKRTWTDTAFWLGIGATGNISNALTADFKSGAYSSLNLGNEMMVLVHNEGTTIYGKALYDVLTAFKTVSLYGVFNAGTTNVTITGTRSDLIDFTDPGTPSDTFIEETNALKINDKREGDGHGTGVSHTYVRFTTTAGENNPSHNLIGLGGEHDSNDSCGHWGWDYEAQNHQGYCNIYAIGTDWVDKGYADYDSCPAGQKDVDYAVFSREATPSLKNISTSSPATEELSPGPIAYWKFDEGVGTTAYDSSSNKNNGVITGATWQTENQCISGKCLDFSGTTQFINVADNPSLDIANEITLSAWVYWHGGAGEHNIITKESAYEIRVSGGYVNFAINPWNWEGATSAPISQDKWEYVVVTHDSDGQQKIYINGIEKFSQNSGGAITVNSDVVTIGGRGAGTFSFFNGLIDDVKIYPYIRTAAQIKLDYNSRGSSKGSSANLGVKSNTAPSLSSKLVAYYKFDENTGTLVNNSGNGGIGLSGVFGASNAAPTWNQGKINKALSFDGGDYVRAPLTTTQTDNWTITTWVKSNSVSGAGGVVQIGGPGCTGYSITRNGSNWQPLFSCVTWNPAIAPVVIGEWIHLAVVRENGVLRAYANGVQTVSGVTSTPGSPSGNYTDMGVTEGGYFFDGLIDEVKIYNAALSADEIKQDYNRGSAIQMGATNQTIGGTTTSLDYCIPGDASACSPPIAEWKLDEGVGTSAYDTSGNNYNGVFANNPTWIQGKIGKGLNITNGNAVNLNTLPTLNNPYTLSYWFYPTSTSGFQQFISLAGSNGFPLFGLNGTQLLAYAGLEKYKYGSRIFGNNDLNKWWFVTFIVNDPNNLSTWKIYLNGIDETGSPGANTGTYYSPSAPGQITGGTSGKIDQVRIYNYVRTPAQVAYDYNKGGPIGWWKFDECQGNIAYDWSGIGNTGTIIIGASGTQNSLGTCKVGTSAAWTAGATGKINSSLNFDGTDDYVSINGPSISSIMPNIYSISSWVKFNSATDAPLLLFGSSNGVYASWNSGRPLLFHDSNNYRYFDSPSNYRDGNWHHMVFIVTGMNINDIDNSKCFIDGKEIAGAAPVKNYAPSTKSTPITIGGTNNYFKGQIDDVRLYNYALTADQIKQIYNGGAVNFQ